MGVIPELTAKLQEAEKEAGNRMLNEEVREEQIAGIVSRWTGIPVDKMLQGERQRLLTMEDELAKRVVGQPEAVDGGLRRPCAAAAPGCRIRTGPSARSCSSAPRASARPS